MNPSDFTPSRRTVLAGAGALTMVAAVRLGNWRDALTLPSDLIPAGRNALVLHDGSSDGRGLLRDVRSQARASVAVHRVGLLSRDGFGDLHGLLGMAGTVILIALLEDAEIIVVETILRGRSARAVTRRRHAGRVLLTAQLQ